MMQNHRAAEATAQPPDLSTIIQFYSIQLAPTADGQFFVGVTATVCEHEGELDNMEMGSGRVATIEQALTVIREAIAPRH